MSLFGCSNKKAGTGYISRRGFIKGAAVAVAGLVALGLGKAVNARGSRSSGIEAVDNDNDPILSNAWNIWHSADTREDKLTAKKMMGLAYGKAGTTINPMTPYVSPLYHFFRIKMGDNMMQQELEQVKEKNLPLFEFVHGMKNYWRSSYSKAETHFLNSVFIGASLNQKNVQTLKIDGFAYDASLSQQANAYALVPQYQKLPLADKSRVLEQIVTNFRNMGGAKKGSFDPGNTWNVWVCGNWSGYFLTMTNGHLENKNGTITMLYHNHLERPLAKEVAKYWIRGGEGLSIFK